MLIDEAGGVAVALAASAGEALALLAERSEIDVTLVSLPLGDCHGSLIDALVRSKVPFVLHEGDEQLVVQLLGEALKLRPRATEAAAPAEAGGMHAAGNVRSARRRRARDGAVPPKQ